MKTAGILIALAATGLGVVVSQVPQPQPAQAAPAVAPGLAPGLTFAPPPQPVNPPWIPAPHIYGPWWTNFNYGQFQIYNYLDDAVNGLAFCLANSPSPGNVPANFPNPNDVNNLANDLTPGSGTILYPGYQIYKMQKPRPN